MDTKYNPAFSALRHHVSGAIARGEKQAIREQKTVDIKKKAVALYGTALRIYDNGGKTFDRYTILPPRYAGGAYRERAPGTWTAIAASEKPYHPQGFGQHVSAMPGRHLGRRIRWCDLPDDVQRFACEAFPDFILEDNA